MNFNLLYLILQKALGKSRESHLNTHCQWPVNRIPELWSPITGTHPQSREPFTPVDPLLPTPTWRPQFHAPWRHLQSRIRSRIDGAQGASKDPEAAPRCQVETQRCRAGRAASTGGNHSSMTTLGQRPGVLTLQPQSCLTLWRQPRSRGPREAHSPRGWRSRGLLARLAGGGAQ